MKFIVTIEEMVSQDFIVDAKTIDEAMQIAENNYHTGEFVLENGNLVAKQMSACDESGTVCTEWVEF